jgi:predicted permease
MRPFLRKLRWLVARRDRDVELREELAFHLEAEAEAQRTSGASRDQALSAARRDLGSVAMVAENTRAEWGWPRLEQVAQDVGYAVRGLRARPAFTLGVVITIALGIGANATMFGIIDQLFFRPPPFLREPTTVHRVYLLTTSKGSEEPRGVGRFARFIDLTKATSSFSNTAGFTVLPLAIGVGEDAVELPVAPVSSTFFAFFNAAPVRGRYFVEAEDRVPSGERVAVLSFAAWQTRYGGRADVIGSTIQIDALVYTIVGVAQEGFVGLWPDNPPVAYIPIVTYGASKNFSSNGTTWYGSYCCGWMDMIVRRKSGVSIDAANADLTQAFARSYAAQLAEQPLLAPAKVARPRAIAGSILTERGPQAREVSKVAVWVGGVSVVVFLIACANLTSLMLARALQRRREMALRLALGVSRPRLASQLLTESLVLAAIGSAAGLLIAHWGGAILRTSLLDRSEAPNGFRDPRTILFAAVAALIIALVTGLAPVLQAGRVSLTRDLKLGAHTDGRRGSRLRAGLVVLQLTLSVVLLVGAGLFVRSLQRIEDRRFGYDIDHLLMVWLKMRGVELRGEQNAQLRRQLLAAAQSAPGVVAATRQVGIPLMYDQSRSFIPDGVDTVGRSLSFTYNAVSPDYFKTMGTRILRGRGFTDADGRHATHVAVISEALGKLLWPSANPIGQCARLGGDSECTYVVGIAENIIQQGIRADDGYYFYVPIEQTRPNIGGLFIRTRGNAVAAQETIRRVVQREMPGASYVTVTPLSSIVGGKTRSWRLGGTMFTVFGGLALLVAAVGLYSAIAYDVAQRRRELGIRIALGAGRSSVLRLVVNQGLALAGFGVAVGIIVALWGARWAKPLLYEISERDPVVFAIVPTVLFCVAIAASVIPAVRAARLDPNLALRLE